MSRPRTPSRPEPRSAGPRPEAGRVAPVGRVTVPPAQGGWPYRWYLVPAGVAAGLWSAAAAAHVWLATPAVVIAVLVACALLVVWARFGLARVTDRVAVFAAALFVLVWLPAAAVVGPWRTAAMVWLGIATVAASVVWCRHPWTRRRVRTDIDVREWPIRADRIGIPGAVLYGIEWTSVGRRLLVELVEGQTWRQVRAETAETVLDVAPGAITVERDRHIARRLVIHVQDVDPWDGDGDGAAGVAHPILAALPALAAGGTSRETSQPPSRPHQILQALVGLEEAGPDPRVAAWSPGAGTVREPIEVGVSPDLQPAALPVWRESTGALHWLIGGMTGSGKSVFLRNLLAGLARCRDVIILGIDTGKRGKAFAPWAPVMTEIAGTVVEAVALLRGVLRIIEESAEHSAREAASGTGSDNVTPSPERPHVAVIVDEAADLLDIAATDPRSLEGRLRLEAVELLNRIGATARSEAVSILLATQTPNNASLGGSGELRRHCTVGVCLRMRHPSDMRVVLQGDGVEELDVSLFRHPGLLYAQDGPDVVPYPIRSYALLDPAQCRQIADVLAPGMARTPDWMRRLLDAEKEKTMPTPHKSTEASVTPLPTNQTRQPDNHSLPAPAPTPTDAVEKAHGEQRPVLGGREDVLERIEAYQAEAMAEIETQTANGPDVPQVPLGELARLHTPQEVEVPGDERARAAILAALASAGPAGMRRGELEAATGLDTATIIRLLAAAERAGQVVGSPGTGPEVVWRAAAAQLEGSRR